jgi:hypothetical protein
MTGGELVSRATITQVWRLLGGPPLRNNRGRAWWRKGDGLNIRLRDDLGVWKDFATGDRGGVVALIQRALDCDKKTACHWLATQLGVDLGPPLTDRQRRALIEQKRRYQQIEQQRSQLIRQLTARRNTFWDADRLASEWARENINNPSDWKWAAFWAHCRDGEIGDQVQLQIERIEQMTLEEFAAFATKTKRRAA